MCVCLCVFVHKKMGQLEISLLVIKETNVQSEPVSPPNGPSGIGKAAIENEMSRSLLWSFSESGAFSSSKVSTTSGG